MSSRRSRSSRRGVQLLRLAKDLVPEVLAEEAGRVQVYLPAEQSGQFALHREEREAGRVAGLELDQNVDVAIRPKVLAQHRAEQRQTRDVAPATKLRECVAVERDPGHG